MDNKEEQISPSNDLRNYLQLQENDNIKADDEMLKDSIEHEYKNINNVNIKFN